MIQWLRKNLITLLLLFIMFFGVGLMLYPTVSDWWNSLHMTQSVTKYASSVASMNNKEYKRMLEEAEEYNQELAKRGVSFNLTDEELKVYNSILNVNDIGIIGYIEIPRMRVTLPIYHGTDKATLEVAIGHIAGTSFPVGGASTHCVISGHRGLPKAKLFTDLVKVTVGDIWTVNVLDQTLTYECDQIKIVEPSDLRDVQIEEGKDYFTLVTCTPYGVNSHRLLVRGHRIANIQGNARVTADAVQIANVYVAPFVALPMLLVLLVVLIISTRRKKSK
ncbi:MAG: class C sortase [Lachnospiraceae bacterium]